jgi:hypothetical protein
MPGGSETKNLIIATQGELSMLDLLDGFAKKYFDDIKNWRRNSNRDADVLT